MHSSNERAGWLAVAGYTGLVLLAWIMSVLGNTDGSGMSYLLLILALFPSSFVMIEIFELAAWDSAGTWGWIGLAVSFVANCALWFVTARRIRRRRSRRDFA